MARTYTNCEQHWFENWRIRVIACAGTNELSFNGPSVSSMESVDLITWCKQQLGPSSWILIQAKRAENRSEIRENSM